jgi:hypothetical protein
MLQPVDFAVVFSAALQRRRGGWSPSSVKEELRLPWSTLNLSLKRLNASNLVRNGRVNRGGLAALLPVLQYLIPAHPDRSKRVRGRATSISAPVFKGQILANEVFVWASDDGTVEGHSIVPLHPRIPESVTADAEIYGLMACIDALRMGRAREVALASQRICELADLPGNWVT